MSTNRRESKTRIKSNKLMNDILQKAMEEEELDEDAPPRPRTGRQPSTLDKVGEMKGHMKDRLVNQEFFQSMVRQAYDEIDINKNGTIDATEFYAGVLLLYQKISQIPWAGGNNPPKRGDIMDIFDTYLMIQNAKGNPSNELDYDTFEHFCKKHFDQFAESLLWRILLVSVVFPFVAVYVAKIVSTLPVVQMLGERFINILPTLIVSGLVTAQPYIELLLRKNLPKETIKELRENQQAVNETVRVAVKKAGFNLDLIRGGLINIADLSEDAFTSVSDSDSENDE